MKAARGAIKNSETNKESGAGFYTANICSEITVKTQVKTVKLNYSFFTVTWTSILLLRIKKHKVLN